ncbi:MAG: ABC transporter ATP-binding protein [Polyangiales bacterium]|nr:ABC transporter ATP-binding protein [Myxococcales bacterium]MCB9658366.1 ABC transporter ATP-binding protein [Sandaracinaceae bacterium]
MSVELEEVHKRYRDGRRTHEAVAGVSLTLAPGTFSVLVGPSGSGKSTLLSLCGGMTTPTSGDVRLFGRSIVALRDHHRAQLRRERVGFVFQDLGLIDSLSLLENVLLPLVPTGGADTAAQRRAEEWLTRLGIAPLAHSRASALSGGERQRGALARALVTGPALLLLDEPTAHVDRESADEIVKVLGALRDEGTIILASTHDPRLAERPEVDRVITLREGKLVDR